VVTSLERDEKRWPTPAYSVVT